MPGRITLAERNSIVLKEPSLPKKLILKPFCTAMVLPLSMRAKASCGAGGAFGGSGAEAVSSVSTATINMYKALRMAAPPFKQQSCNRKKVDLF